MFKKTLLALAITGFAGVASAATIDPKGNGVSASDTIQTISAEGAVGSTSATLGSVEFKIAAAKKALYVNAKKIIVDIEGASLSPSTDAAIALTNAGAGSTADDVTSVVSYPTVKQVVFTITGDNADTNGDGLTLGADSVFAVSGLDLVFDNLTLGSQVKFTISAESAVAGAPIESASSVVTQVISQFSAKANTKLGTDIEIDVEEGRKKFTDGATPKNNSTTDQVVLAIIDKGADIDLLAATVDNATADFTLVGDFNFLDTDADGEVDAAFTLDGTNADNLLSTTKANVGALTATFNVTTDGSVVLPAQVFTGNANTNYDTAAGATKNFSASGFAAGEWTLNGSSDQIAFLPFGTEYAQSITVTNLGSVEGEITVELSAGGVVTTKVLTAKAAKNSVTNISLEVAAMAEEAKITGNAAVKVIVNAPTNNIKVKGLYYSKADADRVLTY